MKKIFKSFSLIINYKTFIITALAVISTYTCFHFGLIAKFPDMLVGVAIVFPVVFSIGSAYTRRETALQRFADFKGHAVAIYFATRDWPPVKEKALPDRIMVARSGRGPVGREFAAEPVEDRADQLVLGREVIEESAAADLRPGDHGLDRQAARTAAHEHALGGIENPLARARIDAFRHPLIVYRPVGIDHTNIPI